MRRTFLSIAVLLLIALPSAAQTATDEMAAAAFSHDALQLTAAAPAATRTVVVDSAPSFSLSLLAPSQTLSVSLVAPNGVTYTVGDPNSAVFESGFFPIDAPATRSGASYLIGIYPSPTVQLESVTSNESTNDKGDGNTEVDIVVENGGLFVFFPLIRPFDFAQGHLLPPRGGGEGTDGVG